MKAGDRVMTDEELARVRLALDLWSALGAAFDWPPTVTDVYVEGDIVFPQFEPESGQ